MVPNDVRLCQYRDYRMDPYTDPELEKSSYVGWVAIAARYGILGVLKYLVEELGCDPHAADEVQCCSTTS